MTLVQTQAMKNFFPKVVAKGNRCKQYKRSICLFLATHTSLRYL